MPLPNSIEARDVSYHLHGYTNAARHLEIGPLVMERGEGIYVYDTNGNRYIEAMAGLWSTALGFSEKRLVAAATRPSTTPSPTSRTGHSSTSPRRWSGSRPCR